jgi:hypothetical protein
MTDYIILMHAGAPAAAGDAPHSWPAYLAALESAGALQGGSAIGDGICVSKSGTDVPIARHITGYLRIGAANLDAARALLAGNPVYEAGGTVEIRELPRTS